MTAYVNNNYMRHVLRRAMIAALIVPAVAISTAMAATNQPGKRSTVAALDKSAALVYEWKTSKGELLVHVKLCGQPCR